MAVIEVEDATLGQLDGAIGDFSSRLATTPDRPAFVYVCGYAASFNDRAFLLPVSASIAQPTDLLSQGVVASSLIRTLAPREAAAVLALDLVAQPGGGEAAAAIGKAAPPAGLGLVAAKAAGRGNAPTALAAALVADLAGPTVRTGTLFDALGTQIKAPVPAVLHAPAASLYLAGAPPPPPPAPAPTPAAPATAPALPASPPAPSPAPSNPAPPVAAPAPAPFPAEADMTDADRREVQAALLNLGYYDGKVDGIFGPDTRAAIRRYQHELHAEMSGVLTSGQATQLVARTKH
jgi:Putative peptidoglycan binding domain